MKYKLLLSFLTILFVLTACNTGHKARKPDVVIRQEIMTSILTDLYLADGLLNVPTVRKNFSVNDSTENYMMVIQKHGFTMEEFDSNIEYYFSSEPRKFEQIYDDVLANLSEIQTKSIETSMIPDPSKRNLWNAKASYRMPDDGTTNPVEFSIRTEGLGLYTIKARITLFEDDQSIAPRATIYFWYDDGSEDGYKDLWTTGNYVKSPRSQTLEFEKQLGDPRITHIKGRFIDYDPQAGHWEMHSSLSGINIIYKSSEQKEASSDNPE